MAAYRFLTTWLLEARRDEVFQALWDSERWPDWWRGVESVRTLEEGDAEGVGSVGHYVWKSRLTYRLEFDTRISAVDRPRYMEGHATGELEGTGRWRLYAEGSSTAVTYQWEVRATAPWMNLLSPVARPVSARNHNVVMGWGAEDIARLLQARLIAAG